MTCTPGTWDVTVFIWPSGASNFTTTPRRPDHHSVAARFGAPPRRNISPRFINPCKG